MTLSRAFLLPIADRKPLGWIVRERHSAFGEHRRREAEALEIGDMLFLYTTRGCFRNPTRDRGHVIGQAAVSTVAKHVGQAPTFGGREYSYVVEIDIETLAPLREGLELAPLVRQLRATFPDPATWSVRMRRALVPLDARDAALIARKLKALARTYAESVPSYSTIR